MRKLLAMVVVLLLIAGSIYAGNTATKSDDNTVTLKLSKMECKEGHNCDRCVATEKAMKDAITELEKQGVNVQIVMEKVAQPEGTHDCSKANQIWINDKPIEEVLNAKVAMSKCTSAHHKGEKAQCRTLTIGDQTYTAIPSDLIVKASLACTGNSAEAQNTSSKMPCARSCAKTCGAAAAAACTGAKEKSDKSE